LNKKRDDEEVENNYKEEVWYIMLLVFKNNLDYISSEILHIIVIYRYSGFKKRNFST
jgi:hypothetical protein